LIEFSPAGEQRWSIKLRDGHFDGRSFAVTRGGRILVWSGRQLRYFGLNGKPILQPIELGVKAQALYSRYDDLFSGADGRYCLQLLKPAADSAAELSNTILVLDSEGNAQARVELGSDSFDLLAAGVNGELYGFREGPPIESGKWTGSRERDVVCLRPAPFSSAPAP
jgi:hypothetical protein